MLSQLPPLIFIWIGELPEWSLCSLSFAHVNNPNRLIYLLTDSVDTSDYFPFAKVVTLNPSYIDDLSNKLPALEYFGNFWIRSSIRLFILNNFVRDNNIKDFFHAELDNAIFNLYDLSHKLNCIGEGIFVPRDAIDRAIASLIYCNRIQSLGELISLYYSKQVPKNDMDAFGIYSNKYPQYFYSLPTESFKENSSRWHIIQPEITGGLFDAASMGQYLLGIDPIHCRFKPCINGFINENCLIDFKTTEFVVKNFNLWIRYLTFESEHRVYNIHLHSKNFTQFMKLLADQKILHKLRKGRKTVVSNHMMIAFGPFLLLLSKIIIVTKSILKKSL